MELTRSKCSCGGATKRDGAPKWTYPTYEDGYLAYLYTRYGCDNTFRGEELGIYTCECGFVVGRSRSNAGINWCQWFGASDEEAKEGCRTVTERFGRRNPCGK